MKAELPIRSGPRSLALVVLTACLGLCPHAYSTPKPIPLLIQQTPAQAGIVAPATGVHYFSTDSIIALVAVPRSGYKFTCWLGDVNSPTSHHTVTLLDRPKIIIAVFEETSRQHDSNVPIPPGTAQAGGGVIGSPVLSAPTLFAPARLVPPTSLITPPSRSRSLAPLPPPPVEPSTVFLLGLGTLILRCKRPGR